MAARIGYDGLDFRDDPHPELLIDVARSSLSREATGSI
jgi:hypothetical protein